MNGSAAAGKWCIIDLQSSADNLSYKHDAKAKTWWNVFSLLRDTKEKNSIWVGYKEEFIF